MKFLSLFCLSVAHKILAGNENKPYFSDDFFVGAQSRPKLEIIKPDNGEVFEDTKVEILIKMSGHDASSSFHDSRLCISLSSTSKAAEQCFDQYPDLNYHVEGLSPGQQYSLRVAYYERGSAIAVSVRNFRVAGVLGLVEGSDFPVDIKTAVQMAVQYQYQQKTIEAENIYRKILMVYPSHKEALQLLGQMIYKQGDFSSAIPYIESALTHGKYTDNTLHNTLGICYRLLGRYQEAEKQFSLSKQLKAEDLVASYHIGLLRQQQGKWQEAIDIFQSIDKYYKTDMNKELKIQEWEDMKIRECDMLQGLGKWKLARTCWENGLDRFPSNTDMLNEIGTLLGRIGEYQSAVVYFRKATSLGSHTAQLNYAHVLELEGYYEESRQQYENALLQISSSGLPAYHIQVRLAAVLPRILPASDHIIDYLRTQMVTDLDTLLEMDSSLVTIDNAPPLYFGFSHGHYLAYHGRNNVHIKSKLAQVYLRMCPALSQGVFMEQPTPNRPGNNVKSLYMLRLLSTSTNNSTSSNPTNMNPTVPSNIKSDNAGYVSGMNMTQNHPVTKEEGQSEEESDSSVCLSDTDHIHISDSLITDHTNHSVSTNMTTIEPNQSSRTLRLGVVSRHIRDGHVVGILTHSIVNTLQQITSIPIQLIIFHITEGEYEDMPLSHKDDDRIRQFIHNQVGIDFIMILPSNDLTTSAMTIREMKLDIILYPEIGSDPITYFLAFARLATHQLCWFGHPDTTGIPNIDYFISSHNEIPTAQSHYHEVLYRMRYLGLTFPDPYQVYMTTSRSTWINPVTTDNNNKEGTDTSLLLTDRTHLLARQALIEKLGIPRAAHIYMIGQPLSHLNSQFDIILSKILLQDKLGYLVIMEETVARRRAWQDLFTSRIAGSYSNDVKSRIVYFTPLHINNIVESYAGAHVVLDPFPVSTLLPNYYALSLGIPVITFPQEYLGGRMALGLYTILEYGYDPHGAYMYNHALNRTDSNNMTTNTKDIQLNTASSVQISNDNSNSASVSKDLNGKYLVVNSIQEYANTALLLTHKPKIRDMHSRELLNRRDKLFSDELRQIAVEDWYQLLQTLISKKTHI